MGGGLDLGVGYNAFLKTLSARRNYSYDEQTSDAVATLVDLNGDGYPDKLFKTKEGLCYRLQQVDKNGNSTFSNNISIITSISDFNRSKSYNHHWGVEAQTPVVKSGVDWTDGVSVTGIYMADVDGDGLVDFVDNESGSIYLNRLDNNGYPQFSDAARSDTIWVGGSCDNMEKTNYILNDTGVDESIFGAATWEEEVLEEECTMIPVFPPCPICVALEQRALDCINYITGSICKPPCSLCVAKQEMLKRTS